MRLPDKTRNELGRSTTSENDGGGKFNVKTIAMLIGAMLVGGIVVAIFFTTGDEKAKNNPPVTVVAEQTETASPAPPSPLKADKDEPKNYYENGQYKVGTDIPAGEYLAVGTGYVELAADSLGKSSSVIFNDNITDAQRYVEARDGEYLRVSGSLKLYLEKDAPKIDTQKKVPAGQYKVGVDISAGEYKITSSDNGYIEVAKSARGRKNGNVVTNKAIHQAGDMYITVKDGQYLQLKNAEARLVQ